MFKLSKFTSKKQQRLLIWLSMACAGLIVIAILIYLSALIFPPKVQTASKQIRPIGGADYVLGKPGAKIKLITYLDFECPFCAQFYQTVKQAVKLYPDDLEVAFRNFPLTTHEQAERLAELAECAGEQGKFFAVADQLFDAGNTARFAASSTTAMIATLGLKNDQFDKCLQSAKYKARILAEKQEAKAFGVIGTPASFLNGLSLPGAYPLNDFKRADGSQDKGLQSLIEEQIEKSR